MKVMIAAITAGTLATGALQGQQQTSPPPERQERPRVERDSAPGPRMRGPAFRGPMGQRGMGRGAMLGSGPADLMAARERLGLTDAQVEQLRNLTQEMQGIRDRAQAVLTPEQRGRVQGWREAAPRGRRAVERPRRGHRHRPRR